MSNDDRHDELDRTLTRLYGDLGEQSRHAPLPPARAIRERGDARSARTRATFALAAAALVAVGVLGGSRLLGDGRDRVVPAPPVPLPAPSASASPSPSASPQAPPAITERAFLSAEDLGSTSGTAENPDATLIPDLCPFDHDAVRSERRTGELVRPPADVPEATVVQEVMVFEDAAAAAAFLDRLRDTVAACPEAETEKGTARFSVAGEPDVADGAVLVRRETPAYDYETGDATSGRLVHWTAAIRSAESVSVFSTADREVSSIDDRAVADELVRHAADRLTAWRIRPAVPG